MDNQPSANYSTDAGNTFTIHSDADAQTAIGNYQAAIDRDNANLIQEEAIVKGGGKASAIAAAQGHIAGDHKAINAANDDIAAVRNAQASIDQQIAAQTAATQAANQNAAQEASYGATAATPSAPAATGTATSGASSGGATSGSAPTSSSPTSPTDTATGVTFTSMAGKSYDITSDAQAQTMISNYQNAASQDQGAITQDEAIIKGGGSASAIAHAEKDMGGRELAYKDAEKDIAGVQAAQVKLDNGNTGAAVTAAGVASTAAEGPTPGGAYSDEPGRQVNPAASVHGTSGNSGTSSASASSAASGGGSTGVAFDARATENLYTGGNGNDKTVNIKAGETFTELAHRYGVSVSAIEAANPGMNPRDIPVGASIKIPGGTAHSDGGSGQTTASTASVSGTPSQGGVGHRDLGVSGTGTDGHAASGHPTGDPSQGGVGHRELGVTGFDNNKTGSTASAGSSDPSQGGVGHRDLGVSGTGTDGHAASGHPTGDPSQGGVGHRDLGVVGSFDNAQAASVKGATSDQGGIGKPNLGEGGNAYAETAKDPASFETMPAAPKTSIFHRFGGFRA